MVQLKNINYMKKILIFSFLLFSFCTIGQQTGLTETYTLNKLGTNPALASYDQKMRFVAIGQYGKANELGSLKNYYLSVEMPVFKSTGASIQYSDYANFLLKSNTLAVGLAQHIKISDNATLSMGLNGGISHIKYDFTSDYGLSYVQEVNKSVVDPSAMASSKSTTSIKNFAGDRYLLGGGVFLNAQKWHIGVAIPNIIKNKLPDSQDPAVKYTLERPAFISLERDINLNKNLKIVGGGLYRISNLPFNKGLDLQASIWLQKKYSLGLWYQRIGALASTQNRPLLATAEISIKNARLAYNFNLTNQAAVYTNIKQQIMLRLDIDYLKKKQTI